MKQLKLGKMFTSLDQRTVLKRGSKGIWFCPNSSMGSQLLLYCSFFFLNISMKDNFKHAQIKSMQRTYVACTENGGKLSLILVF